MKIINEQDALAPLRRARSGGAPTPDDLLSRVLHDAIPAAKNLAEAIGDDSEMALFVEDKHCWLFGNHFSVRSNIQTSRGASEVTCYMRTRDFGQVTIARESGKVSVRIDGVAGADAIELEAFGWDVGGLEAVIPFLFGRGGTQAAAVANQES